MCGSAKENWMMKKSQNIAGWFGSAKWFWLSIFPHDDDADGQC
jgi:hypothetical protein